MSCAERKRFVKNCGLLAQEQVGDNKQKISPNLMKRTDFLVHKAQILVRVFITDLILRHSAEVVETYSQSAENACVYKEFCNTKGI